MHKISYLQVLNTSIHSSGQPELANKYWKACGGITARISSKSPPIIIKQHFLNTNKINKRLNKIKPKPKKYIIDSNSSRAPPKTKTTQRAYPRCDHSSFPLHNQTHQQQGDTYALPHRETHQWLTALGLRRKTKGKGQTQVILADPLPPPAKAQTQVILTKVFIPQTPPQKPHPTLSDQSQKRPLSPTQGLSDDVNNSMYTKHNHKQKGKYYQTNKRRTLSHKKTNKLIKQTYPVQSLTNLQTQKGKEPKTNNNTLISTSSNQAAQAVKTPKSHRYYTPLLYKEKL